MEYVNLFEKFEREGKFLLPDTTISFCEIPWSKHKANEGVWLKHIITSGQTGGQFSYHLVKIAPNKKIGKHVHKEQSETHEVIAGNGICINNSGQISYEPGVISIFPRNLPHEVIAGENGLFLFAKFFPALT